MADVDSKLRRDITPMPAWRALEADDWAERDHVGVWTDDYSNLFSVLRRDGKEEE